MSKKHNQKRDDEIFKLRLIDGLTIKEIADRYDLTKQRISKLLGSNSGKLLMEKRDKECAIILKNNPDKTDSELLKEYPITFYQLNKIHGGQRHYIDKNNSPGKGFHAELLVSKLLTAQNIKHKLMPFHHPFDLLLDNGKRVEIKSAWKLRKPLSQSGRTINNQYTFNLTNIQEKNIDYFILIIAETEDVFIIPRSAVNKKKKHIIMVYPSARPEIGKYQKYLNRYDLLLQN